jgi:ATP-dependent protease ClpP protease subunit
MNPFRSPGVQQHRTQVLAQAPAPAVSDGVATMRLYDPIDSWGGYWGVSAKEFVEALDALPANTTEIRLLINSPGGEVFEGVAILNALRNHSARTVAVVEGIAASSASFIAAGCDELVMMQNSELYIHNAWVLAIGDAADLRVVADDLEQHFDRNIASVYAAKSGDTAEYWLDEMSKDQFLTAQQAVDAKLADRIEGVGDAEKAKARFDLSVFDRSGRVAASINKPPATEPVGSHLQEEVTMSGNNTLADGLRERLGVTDAAASDETLLGALDVRLAEPTATTTPVVTVPEGTTLIDSEVLADLQSDAEQGRIAREEQITARRDSIVATALAEGRIAAAHRQTWRDQLDKDEEGTSALLASLPKNTAVPVTEVGHSDDINAEDSAYNAAWGAEQKEEVA